MNKRILVAMAFVTVTKLCGYAISHSKDSTLKEVTIFVFTDEQDFKKMLKNQGVSKDVLDKMSKIIPMVSTGASAAASALGNPELIPAIKAVGLGLAGAAKYAKGPARWFMEQKYNAAIHKHVKRGNKGKDAKWNWKDIKKDEGVEKDDPYGLFVVFLNPDDKKVLLMTPMKSNAAFGFKAVKKDGKMVGQRAPFERDLKKAVKNPSYVARVYAYLVNRYEHPDKLVRDIKSVMKDLKSQYKAFKKKFPGTKNKMRFIGSKIDEAKKAVKDMNAQDAKELADFFKREIEESKKIAKDPETKEFVNRVIRKFNQFKDATEAIIIKPMAGYQADIKKAQQDKDESGTSAIADIPLLEGPSEKSQNYTTLGLEPGASSEEIRSAYRTLARRWHPDKNPENREEATQKFKEIQKAYDALTKKE